MAPKILQYFAVGVLGEHTVIRNNIAIELIYHDVEYANLSTARALCQSMNSFLPVIRSEQEAKEFKEKRK